MFKSNNDRIKDYKNKGKGNDELRRRRVDLAVELRKQKKDDQLIKRRNVDVEDVDEKALSPLQDQNQVPSVKLSLEEIIAGLQSFDHAVVFKATQAARKSLSKERNPPISQMIDAGLVPAFVKLLELDEYPDIQFEAAWALTNIASGNTKQTKHVVECGALVPLIKLLSSPRTNIAEQAVWALGNIAGDGPVLRDMSIQFGIMKPLISLINADTPVPFMRNIAWTLSNLCRNKDPPPPSEVIKTTLPVFCQLVYHTDKEVISDACWALSYLSDGVNEKIQQVIDSKIVPRMIELLRQDHLPILTPTLRTVGNIVTGNDSQTQYIIEANALPVLRKLLSHAKPSIQKEAAWTISNIAAGNPQQIQAIVDAEILPPLIQCLSTGDLKTKKETMWAINNMCSGGTAMQVSRILELGSLLPVCELMKLRDVPLLLVTLDGITHMLNMASKVGELERLTLAIEECGGLDEIESLQQHENSEIYKSAVNIIDKYFSVEDDVDGLVPSGNSGEYDFAPSMPSDEFTF